MKLPEISLVFFVEAVDDANRAKYEKDYTDDETGVRVLPVPILFPDPPSNGLH